MPLPARINTAPFHIRINRKGVINMGLFKKKKSAAKPSCIAFVDFEHWYISLDRYYSVRPDVRSWANELEKNYDVREIAVFADFDESSEISK